MAKSRRRGPPASSAAEPKWETSIVNTTLALLVPSAAFALAVIGLSNFAGVVRVLCGVVAVVALGATLWNLFALVILAPLLRRAVDAAVDGSDEESR